MARSGRLRRHWKGILIGALGFAFVVFFFVVPFLLTYLLMRAGTRPMDRALTSTPSDHGLVFEDASFTAEDGTSLRGWYLGGGSSDVAVAVGHGLFRSRREVLDRAAFFRKLGYDTLVFDFRRHGESGGDQTTLGYRERQDFLAAARFLENERARRSVVLYGVSMGAAAALLAAAESPDVGAVVADSPFVSLEDTVARHVKLLFGLPRFPFASALLFFLERRGGFDRSELDLERAVRRIGNRPVMIVAGEEDERMPAELQRRLFEASSSPASRFLLVPNARHGAAYRTARERYGTELVEFLAAAGLTPRVPAAGAGEDSSPGSP